MIPTICNELAPIYAFANPAVISQKGPFALLDTKLLVKIFLLLRDDLAAEGHSLCVNSNLLGTKSHLRHKDRRSLLGVFLVCRRFHAIGMTCEELWTGATIDLKDSRDGRLPRAVVALRPFFDRSGSNNRTISFRNFTFHNKRRGLLPNQGATKDIITDAQMAYLNEVLTHVDALHLDSSGEAIAEFLHRNYKVDTTDGQRRFDFEQLIRNPDRQRLKLLSLVMHVPKEDLLGKEIFITAAIERLHLEYCGGPTNINLSHPHTLTELRLTFEMHYCTNIIIGPLLSASTTLEVLEINIRQINKSRNNTHDAMPIISFPRLRSLTITDECYCPQFHLVGQDVALKTMLLLIWAPGLTYLSLTNAAASPIQLLPQTILSLVSPTHTERVSRGKLGFSPNYTLQELRLRNIEVETAHAHIFQNLRALKEGTFKPRPSRMFPGFILEF